MSDIGPPPVGRNSALIDRVKAILMTPKTEWSVIDAEPATISEIYKGYVLPLAAIGPVCSFIGSTVFGYGALGFGLGLPLFNQLSLAIIGYLFSLLGVYLLALIIEFFAPKFGAVKDHTQAFKVAAYASTAAWAAGVFGLLPALSILVALGGIYSFYLIFLGLPILMKAPTDKIVGYAAVVIIGDIAISFLIGLLMAPLIASFIIAPALVSGTVNIPGGGSVDLSKMQAATQRMEEATAKMQNNQNKPAIAASVLQALLPASLPGGFTRTTVESASAGAGGLGGSNAKGEYTSGDQIIRLEVTDMGALGGLAALGGAMNIESNKQTATGYEKTGKVDGRLTTEKWDSAGKAGTYNTIVGDRFMIEASGTAPSIDVFKGAVAAVDISRLEAIAR